MAVGRPSKIRLLQSYEVLSIHWCEPNCSQVILVATSDEDQFFQWPQIIVAISPVYSSSLWQMFVTIFCRCDYFDNWKYTLHVQFVHHLENILNGLMLRDVTQINQQNVKWWAVIWLFSVWKGSGNEWKLSVLNHLFWDCATILLMEQLAQRESIAKK